MTIDVVAINKAVIYGRAVTGHKDVGYKGYARINGRECMTLNLQGLSAEDFDRVAKKIEEATGVAGMSKKSEFPIEGLAQVVLSTPKQYTFDLGDGRSIVLHVNKIFDWLLVDLIQA